MFYHFNILLDCQTEQRNSHCDLWLCMKQTLDLFLISEPGMGMAMHSYIVITGIHSPNTYLGVPGYNFQKLLYSFVWWSFLPLQTV